MPHRLAADDRDRVLGIVMRHRVDGVDLVLAIEVGVEAVHHHDELLPLPVLGRAEEARAGNVGLLGMTRRIGIDDEGAVHALVDVPLQRQGVAVIEVAAEREGVELVGEFLAGADLAGARECRPCGPSGCRGNGWSGGASRCSGRRCARGRPRSRAGSGRAPGHCRSRPGRRCPARSRSPCPRR